jgi:DNA mismatch repair protein MutS2
MNGHALGVLEYDKIVSMLVDRTSFPPGAELAARLAPTVDLGSIASDLEAVSELRAMLDEGIGLPLEGARDIRRAVVRSSREGASLSCEELVDVRRTLAAVHEVRAFLSARRERPKRLWAVAEDLTPHDDVASAIGRAIDEASLEVRDDASRELSRIRRAIARARQRLDDKLGTILAKELAAGTLQEPSVHLRNGRRVLPIKRGARSKLRGIVHDQSQTGATLFVEPLATVELNNELSELAADEREEIERVLRELSATVGAHAEDIGRSVEALGKLDLVRAKAILSRDLDGVSPALNRRGRLAVRNARHPVLHQLASKSGSGVVPLSMELGGDVTTLVISGPNAGGKTVALKTIGLLTLMAQSGLHVPADADTELSVFRDVFADIGDEQSIEQNLSTFSSHLRVIGEILAESGSETLVLIDEIGAGTDPDEGASLAIAVLEDLTDRRVPTVATTHLGTIKTHVHNRPGMVNGSMAFDPASLEPTFRFVPSVPGASHALAIAESLGLPESVLGRARELRDADAAKVDDLLADLSKRERRLTEALESAAVEEERLKLLRRDYEDKLGGVKDERKQIRSEALAESREILERARSLVEETVKELRARDAERQAIRQAREKLSARRAEVVRALDEAQAAERPDEGERPDALAPGMTVAVAGLGRRGELIDLPDGKGKVRVRIKGRTVEVAAEDLRSVPPEERPRTPEVRLSYDVDAGHSFDGELNLRGMTTDEVADAIERFVSAALVHGFSTLRIVHGKGTGALRARTHEVLKGIPAVKSFRLGRWGEGDTGVTILELK